MIIRAFSCDCNDPLPCTDNRRLVVSERVGEHRTGVALHFNSGNLDTKLLSLDARSAKLVILAMQEILNETE